MGAAKEALDAGIKLLVAIPEHVPVRDTMEVIEMAKQKGRHNYWSKYSWNNDSRFNQGRNYATNAIYSEGKIAVLSKSGTLLYEISDALTRAGFGQSITIGIGGDPVNGTRLIDAFDMVKDLPDMEGHGYSWRDWRRFGRDVSSTNY